MDDIKEVLVLLGEIKQAQGEMKGEQTGIKSAILEIKEEQGIQREIVTNQRIKTAKVSGLVTIGGIGLWEVIKQKFNLG